MRVLLYGSALLCAAFFVQLVIWKINLPRRQTRALLAFFFGTLIVGCLILYNAPGISIFGVASPRGLADYLKIASYFISITLAYMITYSAIEADSPTLVMVTRIYFAGPDGMTKEAFEREMSDDLLVIPRINDLLLNKQVRLEGDVYMITPKGAVFARMFIVWRRLIKADKGG